MLDQGTMQIERHIGENEVVVVDIPYDEVSVKIPITSLVIEFPTPFDYEDEKVVSWIYQPKAFKHGQEDQPLVINESNVISIVGPRGMTRSGRVFALRNVDTSVKAKRRKLLAMFKFPLQTMKLKKCTCPQKLPLLKEKQKNS